MRQDIQCLRGVAILFVLAYHLYPSLFVNGFLGVDIFFVISGYLMAQNLTKSKLESVFNFFKFYYRRFRRILPLYYLVVFVTLVLVHLYLGDFWWYTNRRYSLASLFLVTNQLIIHDSADYFREFLADGSSLNAFIHLWSLGVEMQFYLLVPFIFFGLQFLKDDLLRLIAVSLTTLIGFIAFVFINQQFAFNFMFLRLWQFSAGFVALFWKKTSFYKYSEKLKPAKIEMAIPIEKDDLVTVSLSIIALCILPNKIEVLLLRPFVTLATSFVIASESQENQFLKSTTLSYIGDISYVIYLVHWPIIAIFLTSTLKCYLFCIIVTVLASIMLHHLFEKQYLRLDWKVMIPLIFFLVLSNAYLQNSVREHSFWNNTFPAEVQEIVQKNKIMLPNVWETTFSNNRKDPKDQCEEKVLENLEGREQIFGYCKYPKGHGNFSIMMIGNSYVMNLNEPIRTQFNYNYSEYRAISIGEGYGFYADSPGSQRALEIFQKQVQEHKPDVVFISARYSPTIRAPLKPNDEYLQKMNEGIEFLEKYAKKIYILGSHPLYNLNFLNFFLHYAVQRSSELESLHLNKHKADEEMKYVMKRFSMVKCSKCQFYDLSHVFVEGDKYLTFDREQMLSYVDNSIHLTKPALDLCEPVFKRIANEILDFI